jgi:hypothetical protein
MGQPMSGTRPGRSPSSQRYQSAGGGLRCGLVVNTCLACLRPWVLSLALKKIWKWRCNKPLNEEAKNKRGGVELINI